MHRNNLLLHLCYDGTAYYGWQKTRHGPSIEEELGKVLTKILQHPVILQAASRTDAGVHADHQVVNCYTDKSLLDLKRLHTSLNQLLPQDIRVNHVTYVSETFHPSLDCTFKEYLYTITTKPWGSPFNRHFAWHFPHTLELSLMQKGADMLIGRHDFQAFTNTRQPPHLNTVREIFSINIEQRDSDFYIHMQGDHFLYKMARNLAGTLCYIGCNKIALADVPYILKNKKRIAAGVTAPAHGLTLKKVHYPSL
jgi:tRNA pseudouridine38-40 synthase